MSDNFEAKVRRALSAALEEEFAGLDGFENPYADHVFSDRFEADMKKIIGKSEYTYAGVGSRRIRKSLLVALIALMALVIAGCAMAIHYTIIWNESQNDEQKTLDVTFDFEGDAPEDVMAGAVPKTPDGFTITERYDDVSGCMITYENEEGLLIGYSRDDNLETINMSIDNDENALTETTINGYKGYIYSRDGMNALMWADRYHFYDIGGNCDMDILWDMAKSLA